MLTEKDYCDYETCVALKELGFREPTLAYYNGFLLSKPLQYLVIDEDCMPEDGVNVFDLLSNSNKYKDSKNIDAPTLYEAQKWLREEKQIDISITLYMEGYAATIKHFYVFEGEFAWKEPIILQCCKSHEEALSEGIKEAVKILKEK